MAKRKQPNAIAQADEQPSTAPPVEPVPADPVGPAAAIVVEIPPAPRLYRVSLPAVREMTVEASSPEEAFAKYMALNGITASVHRPDVVEV